MEGNIAVTALVKYDLRLFLRTLLFIALPSNNVLFISRFDP